MANARTPGQPTARNCQLGGDHVRGRAPEIANSIGDGGVPRVEFFQRRCGIDNRGGLFVFSNFQSTQGMLSGFFWMQITNEILGFFERTAMLDALGYCAGFESMTFGCDAPLNM
jgi:hypothetical protein